jgi:peroxiredoxin family protein
MSIGASGSVASTTSVSPPRNEAIRRFAIVSGKGQSRPRASTVVTIGIVTVAAILTTGEPERLYAGLSVLVSTAADGEPCAALASFGALGLLLDPDLLRKAQEPDATPSLSWAGREKFATSLVELVDTALELDQLTLHACAASVETMAIEPADIEARGMDGVKSTPRFLRDNTGAKLIFV